MGRDQQWEVIVGRLGKIRDEGERNRIGVELFGKVFKAIAAGVADDYQKIADAAKIAGDAQLLALDAAGDRIDKFKRDFGAGMQEVVAEALFAFDELRKLSFTEAALRGLTVAAGPLRAGAAAGLAAALLAARGRKRAIAELEHKNAADAQRQATEAATKTQTDYVAQLQATEAQLKNLDAVERKQIAAAQELGADTDVVTEMLIQFGVSAANAEGALKLLNSQRRRTTGSSCSINTRASLSAPRR
jgi:hypothetical protein